MVTSVPWQLSSTEGKNIERPVQSQWRTPQRGPRAGRDNEPRPNDDEPRPTDDEFAPTG
jgi:hypothetical protein